MVQKARMAYRVSERRACHVLAQARTTQRYDSVKDDQAPLRSKIKEIAATHVTWGYLRVWVKMRREGWRVNKRQVDRLYKQEGLCLGRLSQSGTDAR